MSTLQIVSVETIKPEYFSMAAAAKWSGFSIPYLRKRVAAKDIVSKNVKPNGQTRGVRLIHIESLREFIESEGNPKKGKEK